MDIIIDAASRVGQVRKNNEDMILVGDKLVRDGVYRVEKSLTNRDMFCVALADGMGGHNSGERASEVVLKSLSYVFKKPWSYMDAGMFNEAAYLWLEHINRYVESLGASDPKLEGMGTTLVGVVFNYNDLYWVNCGDSRVYSFRGGILKQLSNDHSLSNMMGETRHNGMIVNCIGAGCTSSYIDFVEFSKDIRQGDTLLLCSDGLTDMIDNEELQMIMRTNPSADELCQLADDAGGHDNISVCLVKVKNI